MEPLRYALQKSFKEHRQLHIMVFIVAAVLVLAGGIFLFGGNYIYNNEVTNIYNQGQQTSDQQQKSDLLKIKQGLDSYYSEHRLYPASLQAAGLDSYFNAGTMEYRLISRDNYLLKLQLHDGSYYDLSN